MGPLSQAGQARHCAPSWAMRLSFRQMQEKLGFSMGTGFSLIPPILFPASQTLWRSKFSPLKARCGSLVSRIISVNPCVLSIFILHLMHMLRGPFLPSASIREGQRMHPEAYPFGMKD
jgi:hypothetical protein